MMQASGSGQGLAHPQTPELNRPGTSMSTLSGSGEYLNDEGSQSGWNSKRASVLSFQTAHSGGHTSAFGTHSVAQHPALAAGPGPSSSYGKEKSPLSRELGAGSAGFAGIGAGFAGPGPSMGSQQRASSGSSAGAPPGPSSRWATPAASNNGYASASEDEFQLPGGWGGTVSPRRSDEQLSKPLPPDPNFPYPAPPVVASSGPAPPSKAYNEPRGNLDIQIPPPHASPQGSRQASRTGSLDQILDLDVPASAIVTDDAPIAAPSPEAAAGLDRDRTIKHRKNASSSGSMPLGDVTANGVGDTAAPSRQLPPSDSDTTMLAPRPVLSLSTSPQPGATRPDFRTQATDQTSRAAHPNSAGGLAPPAEAEYPDEPIRSPAQESEVTLSQVVPPPLPKEVNTQLLPPSATTATIASDEVPSPVADFRAIPLSQMNAASAGNPAAAAQAQQQRAAAAAQAPSVPSTSYASQAKEMQRRLSSDLLRSQQNAEPKAQEASQVDQRQQLTRQSSAESIEREPSPPPDGEVEARAEWERQRRTKKTSKDKLKSRERSSSKSLSGIFSPQDLVTGGSLLQSAGAVDQRQELGLVDSPMNSEPPPPLPSKSAEQSRNMAQNGPATVTTQQLQKQQAKDQRRSLGTMQIQSDPFGRGVSGPYPTFPSPTFSAARTVQVDSNGKRQYPGMMPQRSLVPPFELQQRPEALLSGLIGPDGVRKSVNDPDVCLECMMRDEDMIDVTVTGHGIWERESDKEFHDAALAEKTEEELHLAESIARGDSAGPLPPLPEKRVAGGRFRVKKIAVGDPLTAERLKLHTQMVSRSRLRSRGID